MRLPVPLFACSLGPGKTSIQANPCNHHERYPLQVVGQKFQQPSLVVHLHPDATSHSLAGESTILPHNPTSLI